MHQINHTMKKINPKISYDSDSDVLVVRGVQNARIDHARELGNFVVHFTKDDRPVLIEVLEASKLFAENPKPFRKMADLVTA